MTTREQLIDGLSLVIREGLRVTSSFAAEDWKKPVQGDEGWNRKQIYCHLAAAAEIAPGFLGGLAQASEGQNVLGGIDVDAFNAQMVAAKEQLSTEDLMKTFTSAYEKLIEFTKSMPGEQIELRRSFGAVEGTVADLMDSVLVLHGLAHIYSAGASATG